MLDMREIFTPGPPLIRYWAGFGCRGLPEWGVEGGAGEGHVVLKLDIVNMSPCFP